MAVNQVRNVAPFIKDVFYVTSPWWTVRSGVIHRGLDIATSTSKPVYSILDGRVHSIGYNSTRGNWIIIEDTNTHYATLYMHLAQRPLLTVGQNISKGDYIALEGTTGTSTGIHLHVEMQDISRFGGEWHISNEKTDYIDPTSFMGIDNIKNSSWQYIPEHIPPQRTSDNKSNFPWVIYSKRLRIKRNLQK